MIQYGIFVKNNLYLFGFTNDNLVKSISIDPSSRIWIRLIDILAEELFNQSKHDSWCRISSLTRQLVRVGAEQHTQSRLVVDGATGVVGLALLQAVGQHQSAGDVVQYVRRRRENVPAHDMTHC